MLHFSAAVSPKRRESGEYQLVVDLLWASPSLELGRKKQDIVQ